MTRRPIPNPSPVPPWPNPGPVGTPPRPGYAPDVAERAEARRRLAQYDGSLDRQADATLGVLQADVTILGNHLDLHPECDRSCAELAGIVRGMRATSAAFDAATGRQFRRAA